MNRKIFALLVLWFALLPLVVQAQVQPTSGVIPFSGTIPAQPDGPADLRLRLFPVPSGGTQCFEETQTVQVTTETFFAFIGDATTGGIPPSPCFTGNASLWIAFGLNSAPDVEIGGRTPIASSGYAHFAQAATNAQTLNLGASVSGSLPGSALTLTNTSATGEGLVSTALVNGVRGLSDGAGGRGVVGSATASSGIGVKGEATMATGTGGVFQNLAGGKVLSGLSGPGPGTEVFSVAGNGNVFVSGNLGIGTTSPARTLHVAGTAVGGNIATRVSNSDSSGASTLDLITGPSNGIVSLQGPTAGAIGGPDALVLASYAGDGKIVFVTNGNTERVRIGSSGNVGIGTTVPGENLSVKGTVGVLSSPGSTRLRFSSDDADSVVETLGGINLNLKASGGNVVKIFTNSQSRVIVDPSGNVGIGTTSPLAKLDVNGAVKATSFDGAGTLPVGAIILWMESATCPSGFTRVAALDGRFTLGSATPGVTGGFSSHSHTFGFSGTTGPSGGISVGTSGFITGAAPPNHVHGFSGGGTTDFSSSLPPFTSVLFCRRAAPVLASAGGVQANVSDVALKENFAPVDGKPLLARLAAIPIQTWNYKSEDRSIRHMGPMAQDFYAAFGLGEDDKHINTVDSGGVALAAIQELYRMGLELEKKTVELVAKSKAIEELSQRIEALERLVKGTQTARSEATK